MGEECLIAVRRRRADGWFPLAAGRLVEVWLLIGAVGAPRHGGKFRAARRRQRVSGFEFFDSEPGSGVLRNVSRPLTWRAGR